MSVLHLPVSADVLLFYPGRSLGDQLGPWAARHTDRLIEMCFERSLPEIREALKNVGIVVIDATEDPAQATDAFLQAVARLGANAVMMYTERMHDDLEMFARVHGSLFVLGPLFEYQWDELIGRMLGVKDRQLGIQRAAHKRRHTVASIGRKERFRSRFANRFRARLDWPFSDNNN